MSKKLKRRVDALERALRETLEEFNYLAEAFLYLEEKYDLLELDICDLHIYEEDKCDHEFTYHRYRFDSLNCEKVCMHCGYEETIDVNEYYEGISGYIK